MDGPGAIKGARQLPSAYKKAWVGIMYSQNSETHLAPYYPGGSIQTGNIPKLVAS